MDRRKQANECYQEATVGRGGADHAADCLCCFMRFPVVQVSLMTGRSLPWKVRYETLMEAKSSLVMIRTEERAWQEVLPGYSL